MIFKIIEGFCPTFIHFNGYIKLLILLAFFIFLTTVFLLFYMWLSKKIDNSEKIAKIALIHSLKGPTIFFLWTNAVVFSIKTIENNLHFDFYDILNDVKIFLNGFAIFWFIYNFVNQFIKSMIKNKIERGEKVDYGLIEFLKKIIIIILVLIILIVILDSAGINIKGLLALGGIGGIAVGFAAKDLLSNLLGGLSIFLDKPFSVEDWISLPSKNIEGVVKSIGWRQTMLKSFADYPIYLPNSMFAEIIIENKSRATCRKIEEVIAIRLCDSDKIGNIVFQIKQMIDNDKEVDQTQSKVVSLTEIGASSLNIALYLFSKTTDFEEYRRVKQKILLESIAIVKRNGAELEIQQRIISK